jgi:hypothetical protein
MKHVFVLAVVLAVWTTPATADSHYIAQLSSEELAHSTSAATGDFSAVFNPSGEHPGPCPGDSLMRIDLYTTGLECEPDTLAIEKRVEGVAEWSIRVPFGTYTEVEFPPEYCADMPPPWQLDGDVWARILSRCYPDGEIGGRIWIQISDPIQTVSWRQVKTAFE